VTGRTDDDRARRTHLAAAAGFPADGQTPTYITIGVYSINRATGERTTVREPTTMAGTTALQPHDRFPLCECPQCRERQADR
jgi:hypothetical protein